MTKLLGLIGYPLTHSFSKKYFSEKFDRQGLTGYSYELFPLENINDFPKLVEQRPTLAGLNVTIPYKVSVIPFLDELDETAKAVGAVNTIKVGSRILKGYNTDVFGFEESLSPLLKPHHRQALIAGTGGASKAVAYVLTKLAIHFHFVSRTPRAGELSYQEIDKQVMNTHKLIINTTPLGMYPKVNDCPDFPYENVTSEHLFYDLVYNPSETLFLKKAKSFGAAIKNGEEMLVLQAEKAWEIWNE